MDVNVDLVTISMGNFLTSSVFASRLVGHKNSAKLKVTYYKSASTSAETYVAKCNKVNGMTQYL